MILFESSIRFRYTFKLAFFVLVKPVWLRKQSRKLQNFRRNRKSENLIKNKENKNFNSRNTNNRQKSNNDLMEMFQSQVNTENVTNRPTRHLKAESNSKKDKMKNFNNKKVFGKKSSSKSFSFKNRSSKRPKNSKFQKLKAQSSNTFSSGQSFSKKSSQKEIIPVDAGFMSGTAANEIRMRNFQRGTQTHMPLWILPTNQNDITSNDLTQPRKTFGKQNRALYQDSVLQDQQTNLIQVEPSIRRYTQLTMSFPSVGGTMRFLPRTKMNPNCPKCHPQFIIKDCTPCLIIR